MSGPKHRPPPHLGDPPALPLPTSQNGKGWNRRPTYIAAASAARSWARLYMECPACHKEIMRGSKTCWRCGAGLDVTKQPGEKKRSHGR